MESTCDLLRPIASAPGEDPGPGGRGAHVPETIAAGTSLFELYLTLQQMAGWVWN